MTSKLETLLAELRKLDAEATEGPWEWVGVNLESNNWKAVGPVLEFTCDTSFGLTGACPSLTATKTDQELIIQYRNETPKLIKVIETLLECLSPIEKCTCDKAYSERSRIDPSCVFCNLSIESYKEEIESILEGE
jgi:hypothetical protein